MNENEMRNSPVYKILEYLLSEEKKHDTVPIKFIQDIIEEEDPETFKLYIKENLEQTPPVESDFEKPKVITNGDALRAVDKWRKEQMEETYIKIKDPFDVIDALRGNMSGDYEKDLKILHKNDRTCTKELYDDAYQMDQQQ